MKRVPMIISDGAREAAASWCIRLSDGALSRDERWQFQAWLDSDPDHPALLERTVAAWQALEHQAGDPELIRLRSEALESVSHDNHDGWRRRIEWRTAMALAAMLLAVVAMGAWWAQLPTSYRTGFGERQVIALGDGSRISLDAATQVDVKLSRDRRELWLRNGRAKFTVAKDPLRPFSVHAGDKMVVATGTDFSVEQLQGQVRVVLYEGKVAVVREAQSERPRRSVVVSATHIAVEQALSPGSELIMSDGDTRVEKIETGSSLGWESGLLQFRDESLALAVERMNRYSTRKLSLGDASASSISISGQFMGGDVDAFVEGVTAVFPYKSLTHRTWRRDLARRPRQKHLLMRIMVNLL